MVLGNSREKGNPMTGAEIINDNLRKLTRLGKMLELSKGRPEFEALRQKYEAIYDATALAQGELPGRTRWGIPISDDRDVNDPIFQRHPNECDCYRNGALRCGIPCIWAWPPGAKIGSKAMRPMRPGGYFDGRRS